MTFPDHRCEARLLADRLRWIKDQHTISLTQAKEVCDHLGAIIHFLDQLVEIDKMMTPNPADLSRVLSKGD